MAFGVLTKHQFLPHTWDGRWRPLLPEVEADRHVHLFGYAVDEQGLPAMWYAQVELAMEMQGRSRCWYCFLKDGQPAPWPIEDHAHVFVVGAGALHLWLIHRDPATIPGAVIAQ